MVDSTLVDLPMREVSDVVKEAILGNDFDLLAVGQDGRYYPVYSYTKYRESESRGISLGMPFNGHSMVMN